MGYGFASFIHIWLHDRFMIKLKGIIFLDVALSNSCLVSKHGAQIMALLVFELGFHAFAMFLAES